MATKDDRPNLLSKMAMFVRNPTKDWSELDRPEPEQEAGYDKQALKAMIERKRQNDFVRKREFDNLRKLRRKDPIAMAGAARPSFFQSSLPADAEGRADTLKKIDEIEAQMSKQWWKGKQEAAAAQASGFPVATPPADRANPDSIRVDAPTEAPSMAEDPFAPTAVAGLQRQTPAVEFAATEMGAGMPPLQHKPAAQRNLSAAPGQDGDAASFSSSSLLAIESDDLMTDPELEEAAIRFANGDDVGAESALVDALRGEALVPEVAQVWVVALLDFYRATGQQQAFERAVMEHGARLDYLRPRWIDIAEVQSSATADIDQSASPSAGSVGARSVWSCPPELTAAGMEDLRVSLSQTPPPWNLDWSQLNDIADNALPFLAGLFGSLCTEPVAVRFTGGDRLAKALRDLTPSGSRGADDTAWTVRLDALRTMQLQDEFELAALDFCITFEVPPPDWQPAQCSYRSGDGDGESAASTQMGGASTSTIPLGLNGASGSTLQLSGQVVGESGAVLTVLGVERVSGAHLVVSCKGLLRVDFAAAGSLLNWAATCHSQGCQVQFRDVHRLVAAFFNVIGITEYARVKPLAIE